MPITVVLAIGLDAAILETQRAALRSAGYFVTAAVSLSTAMEQFREGDFDLVLMGQSIPAESRDRMSMMLRATGSNVPVACVAETANYFEALEAACASSDPRSVLHNIGDLIAYNTRKPTTNVTAIDSERRRRLAG